MKPKDATSASPGQMKNAPLLAANCKIQETTEKYTHQNFQILQNLQEGEHYTIVEEVVHNFWKDIYGEDQEILRFGIENEDGST